MDMKTENHPAPAERDFGTVAVIGLGLLGGSMGLTMRARKLRARRIGWARRSETVEKAVSCGAIESSGSLEDVLGAADLTVLCLPVPEIVNFMRRYAGAFKKGSVVTDIGSVKRPMAAAAECIRAAGCEFVGSHPMAGTEFSGIEHAFPGLYDNADTFVVGDGASPEAVALTADFWRALGTRVRFLSADRHDMVVAYTSHISHLAAQSLVLAALDCDGETRKLRYSGCATGFRDTSRIASSKPEMWREICEANTDVILEACEEFRRRFDALTGTLARGDFDGFEELWRRGRELRGEWLEYKSVREPDARPAANKGDDRHAGNGTR